MILSHSDLVQIIRENTHLGIEEAEDCLYEYLGQIYEFLNGRSVYNSMQEMLDDFFFKKVSFVITFDFMITFISLK